MYRLTFAYHLDGRHEVLLADRAQKKEAVYRQDAVDGDEPLEIVSFNYTALVIGSGFALVKCTIHVIDLTEKMLYAAHVIPYYCIGSETTIVGLV